LASPLRTKKEKSERDTFREIDFNSADVAILFTIFTTSSQLLAEQELNCGE